MERHFDTVFFDMDGTLIDTEKYYNPCWVAALQEFGYEMTREEALVLRSFGRPHVLEFFAARFGADFPYAAVRNRRKELMEEMIRTQGIQVRPGAQDLLRFLKEEGVRCMIATATDMERTQRYLEMVGLAEYFEQIISAVMVKQGKPSPDIYLYACAKAGRKPQECYAVEDAPNGVRSAAAAGVPVLMVPDLSQPDEELRALCTGVFDSLSGVKEYLERQLREGR